MTWKENYVSMIITNKRHLSFQVTPSITHPVLCIIVMIIIRGSLTAREGIERFWADAWFGRALVSYWALYCWHLCSSAEVWADWWSGCWAWVGHSKRILATVPDNTGSRSSSLFGVNPISSQSQVVVSLAIRDWMSFYFLFRLVKYGIVTNWVHTFTSADDWTPIVSKPVVSVASHRQRRPKIRLKPSD